MANKLMLGFWRFLLNVPPNLWQKQIYRARKRVRRENSFMTKEHRLIHHTVVRELPETSMPLGPDYLAKATGVKENRVREILDELEKRMTFIWRNPEGSVVWAYPVTVEKTPHRVTFSSGQEAYAA